MVPVNFTSPTGWAQNAGSIYGQFQDMIELLAGPEEKRAEMVDNWLQTLSDTEIISADESSVLREFYSASARSSDLAEAAAGARDIASRLRDSGGSDTALAIAGIAVESFERAAKSSSSPSAERGAKAVNVVFGALGGAAIGASAGPLGAVAGALLGAGAVLVAASL